MTKSDKDVWDEIPFLPPIAMQEEFFKNLSYSINEQKNKAGYSWVDYKKLMKVLENARHVADILRYHQNRGALKVGHD